MTETGIPPISIAFRRPQADTPFLRHLYGTTRERGNAARSVDARAESRVPRHAVHGAEAAHYEEYYPQCQFLVIELEGRPIGRLYIDRGEDDIRITDIALLPEFRGRGIGRMLMEEDPGGGRGTGKRVTIHVEHDNPARRLYDRLGFRHVDTNGVYHLMEWSAERRDALAISRQLSEGSSDS